MHSEEYQVFFDPNAFAELHPELRIEDFELEREELRILAVSCSSLRQGIKERVGALA